MRSAGVFYEKESHGIPSKGMCTIAIPNARLETTSSLKTDLNEEAESLNVRNKTNFFG